MSSIGYRPEIDGLRTVAVIPVILFHLGLTWVPGGFAGVDIFFVISGFLITSIIVKDFNSKQFSFAKFWQKRVRRIMPALIATVLVTQLVGAFILFGPDINDLGQQSFASLLSVANFNYWLSAGNYWGAQAENSSLLHTWSLSVEEQFYLFFPLLLVMILKFDRKHLLLVLSFLSLASLVLFLYGIKNNPVITFYMLPTRAWELGLGALLAAITLCDTQVKFAANALLGWLGLGLVALFYVFNPVAGELSAWVIAPVAGTLLIIAFVHDSNSLIYRLLASRPFVFVGGLSYSLYIWHWPIIVLLKHFNFNRNADYSVLWTLPVIALVSLLSFYCVEKPLRHHVKALPIIAVAFIFSLALSVYFKVSDNSEDLSAYEDTVWYGEKYNSSPLLSQNWDTATRRVMEGIMIPTRTDSEKLIYANGGAIKLYGANMPEIVVLGDSHALMWAATVDEIAQELKLSISVYAADGTPAFFNIPVEKGRDDSFFNAEEKLIYDTKRLEFLTLWQPSLVIVSARWSKINNTEQAQALVSAVTEAGASVLFLDQPPELYFGDKNTPQFLANAGLVPEQGRTQFIPILQNPHYTDGQELVARLLAQCAQCQLLTISDLYVNAAGNAQVLDGGHFLYTDDDHLSYYGASKAKARLKDAIAQHFAIQQQANAEY